MFSKEEQWLLEEKYARPARLRRSRGGRASRESAAFVRDRARLASGEPVDYVIGFVDFLGSRIDVSLRPLIPRPETEYWTEQLLSAIGGSAFGGQIVDLRFKNAEPKILRVLDLFAGSGCIGIALARVFSDAHVDFADIDGEALRQTEVNCLHNGIDRARFRLFQSDVFLNISDRYDLIVANPPYIAEEGTIGRLEESVHRYEPHRALFGGLDGLALIRRFLLEAPNFLRPDGWLAMEFDDIQRTRIEALVRQDARLEAVFHTDQYGKDRWLSAHLPVFSNSKMILK